MRSSRSHLTLVFLLVLVVVAGCGENDGPGEPSISKTAFQDRANSECAAAARKARTIPPPTTSAANVDFGLEMGATVKRLRDDLLTITRQTGGVDDTSFMAKFDRYTGHLAEQLRALDELSKATLPETDVVGNFRMLRQPEAPRLAAALGLQKCVAANDAIVKTP